jgi:tRNA(fMet)-specific endonuclease VapC
MARSVLLETSVIVAFERGVLRPADVLQRGDSLAISAITAAELLVAAELAPADRAPAKRQKIDGVLAVHDIVDYDLSVARVHALLMAHARRNGQPRGAYDLAIAATAVASRRLLITTDAKAKLSDLPGLDVEVVTSSMS